MISRVNLFPKRALLHTQACHSFYTHQHGTGPTETGSSVMPTVGHSDEVGASNTRARAGRMYHLCMTLGKGVLCLCRAHQAKPISTQ